MWMLVIGTNTTVTVFSVIDSIAGCLSWIVTINFVFLWPLSSVNEK